MYLLVRRDLHPSYRAAQVAHAISEFALNLPDIFSEWNNGTVVVLSVRNLIELRDWIKRLCQMGRAFSAFEEPDLDGHPTALACYDKGEIFKGLPLA